MDKQIKIEIEEVMEELFADDYKRGKDWNGYEVYEPLYKKPISLGPPLVVFVKNNEVRMSTPEEVLHTLNLFKVMKNLKIKPTTK